MHADFFSDYILIDATSRETLRSISPYAPTGSSTVMHSISAQMYAWVETEIPKYSKTAFDPHCIPLVDCHIYTL